MLVVDVYNVLHVTGVLPPEIAGPDAPALARLVARSRYRGRGAVLVCDGTPKPGERGDPDWGGGIRLVHAGRGRDADGLIERLISEHTAPRRLLVVSDDRRLRTAARRRRAGWLGSAAFLGHLAEDATSSRGAPGPEKPGPLDPEETDAWLREFGFGTEDAEDWRPEPSRDDLDMRRWLDE